MFPGTANYGLVISDIPVVLELNEAGMPVAVSGEDEQGGTHMLQLPEQAEFLDDDMVQQMVEELQEMLYAYGIEERQREAN